MTVVWYQIPTDAHVMTDALPYSCFAYVLFDHKGQIEQVSDGAKALNSSLHNILQSSKSCYTILKQVAADDTFVLSPTTTNPLAWLTEQRSLELRCQLNNREQEVETQWVQVSCVSLHTGQWVATLVDVTAEKLHQQEMQAQRELFESFATIASDWLWVLDKDLRYVYHSMHVLPPFIDNVPDGCVIGKYRLDLLDGVIVKDEAYAEHIQCLKNREPFDHYLTFDTERFDMIYTRTTGRPFYDADGKFKGFLGCSRDITEVNIQNRQMRYFAHHDHLTQLLNRRSFEDRLAQLHEDQSQARCLCYIDLDRFKNVNDEGGHAAGDLLLQELSEIFSQFFEEDSVLARLGGDEFGVILSGEAHDVSQIINRLIKHIDDYRFEWNDRRFSIGLSVGIASMSESYGDVSELLSAADMACYLSKQNGRNQASVHNPDGSHQVTQQIEQARVGRLREVIDQEALVLYLQPIQGIRSEGPPSHFEVLMRIPDEKGELQGPADYIPAAEKYDLMHVVDRMVLMQSLECLHDFHRSGVNISLSINLSGNSLNRPESLLDFEQIITRCCTNPEQICFEITETMAIQNLDAAIDFIDRLKRLGCRFALDDFGSGMSSFRYLKSLPVDYLKIDGEFVKEVLVDDACRAIVSSFSQLSHELGMQTVAEFVQDNQTRRMLADLGIDFVQGYGVGIPRHHNEWLRALTSESKLPVQKAA